MSLTRAWTALACAGLALAGGTRLAYGWGQHYLVTDRAFARLPALSESVAVEPLEGFLADQRQEIARLFEGYYAWLKARGSKRFYPMDFDVAHPTEAAFIKAARLNPATRFFLMERLFPGEPSRGGREISFVQVSPYEEGKSPPFLFRFEDVAGKSMPARKVLATFADEPDWAMDIDLWRHPEYGYGKVPYGQETGGTSKAAFHILYRHENFIVRAFAPEMLDGMTLDRIELFSRLARLALRTGHRYWGYRFAAWAIHYIEDLGQPYHSKAIPSAGAGYYVKFMLSMHKDRIKKETTQLVKNRHYAYEDFVAYGLQQSYVESKELFRALGEALGRGDEVYAGVASASELVDRVGDFAAGHACAIDEAVVQAYGPRMTEDPSYDIEADTSYQVRKVVDDLSPAIADRILRETARDFENTGRGARTLLTLILAR